LGVKVAGAQDWQHYHLHDADFLEICEPHLPETLGACLGLFRD
jgi:hypothetical protein